MRHPVLASGNRERALKRIQANRDKSCVREGERDSLIHSGVQQQEQRVCKREKDRERERYIH